MASPSPRIIIITLKDKIELLKKDLQFCLSMVITFVVLCVSMMLKYRDGHHICILVTVRGNRWSEGKSDRYGLLSLELGFSLRVL